MPGARTSIGRVSDGLARTESQSSGNGDVHRLEQLGTTYSLVDAAPSPDAICEAIRQGQVQVSSTPLPLRRAVWIFAKILLAEVVRSARRVFGMPVRATDRGLRQEKET